MIEVSMPQAWPAFSPRKKAMSSVHCLPGFQVSKAKPASLMTLTTSRTPTAVSNAPQHGSFDPGRGLLGALGSVLRSAGWSGIFLSGRDHKQRRRNHKATGRGTGKSAQSEAPYAGLFTKLQGHQGR